MTDPDDAPEGLAELLADHSDAVVATVQRLRTAVHEAHPLLSERVRLGWRSINYRDDDAGFVCAIFPLVDRAQLVFEHGARLPDPRGLLTGGGRQVRVLEFRSAAAVDPAVVTEYLDLAVEFGIARRSG
jgi:hypothetical protein